MRWLQSLPRSNMKRRNYCLSQKDGRRVVALAGDGINDPPVCLKTTILELFRLILLFQALTAIVESNLHTLLILTDSSRKVLRRVKFKFFI